MSSWQSLHCVATILYSVSLPLRPLCRRHLPQSTFACRSWSGYFDVACSFTPYMEGFQLSTVWHGAHSPLSVRAANCPLCSSLWQSMHLPNAICVLKSLPLWQSLQATVMCFPSRGNFVFWWSKPTSCAIFFQLEVTWQLSQDAVKLPLCGSAWQPVHFANESPVYFVYGFASWITAWHFTRSTFSCAPVKGYFSARYLNLVRSFP